MVPRGVWEWWSLCWGMALFRIAVVGRPNVGKSSLLNMLAGRRISIVDDTPGTTRDRVSAIVGLHGEDEHAGQIGVEVTDTGGYGVYTADGRRIDDAGKDLAGLTGDIEKQIATAVNEADLVLFVVDAQAGLTPLDREVSRLLREGGLGALAEGAGHRRNASRVEQGSAAEKVVVVANKCDGPRWEAHALEAAGLGFGEPLVVSAKNNYRRRDLVERLHEIVRERIEGRKRAAERGGEEGGDGFVDAIGAGEMKLAIVGKRNAGKSTLVNTLAGQERVIVSEIAGTTRDAIDVRFEQDGKSFVAIDTAGVRRKRSLQDRIEWWALDRCVSAIERADVCLLMIDATEAVSMVDKQLGRVIGDRYKPCVIVVNKWDLAEGRPRAGGPAGSQRAVTTGDFEKYLRDELKGLASAPIAFISAKNGRNVEETIRLAFELHEQAGTRVTTGLLNRTVRELFRTQGPTNNLGSRLKLFYVAQVSVRPPTIVFVVNKPEMFSDRYERFLRNRLREALPFPEVPLKLVVRPRRQDEEIVEGSEGTEEALLAGATELGGREGVGEEFAAGGRGAGGGGVVDVESMDWSVEPLDAASTARLFEAAEVDEVESGVEAGGSGVRKRERTPARVKAGGGRVGRPRAGSVRAEERQGQRAKSAKKKVVGDGARAGRGESAAKGRAGKDVGRGVGEARGVKGAVKGGRGKVTAKGRGVGAGGARGARPGGSTARGGPRAKDGARKRRS